MQLPNYIPSNMTIDDIRTVIAYYDNSGMMLQDGINFPSNKHYYAKVWDIKNDPQLGDAFIQYALGLQHDLNSKKSPLNIWYKKEKEKLIQDMNWTSFNKYTEEGQALIRQYSSYRKKVKEKWALRFKEMKRKEGREIGSRSIRSVIFLKGA